MVSAMEKLKHGMVIEADGEDSVMQPNMDVRGVLFLDWGSSIFVRVSAMVSQLTMSHWLSVGSTLKDKSKTTRRRIGQGEAGLKTLEPLFDPGGLKCG